MTTQSEIRLYGVSSGNGNNGISRMFADYYVRTNDPWRLAELAIISQFKPGSGQAWAQRNADIDGEEEYGISACIYNPPCEDSSDGEYPDSDDPENEEDGRNWSEFNGAWLLVDTWRADSDEDTRDRPVYDSIEECFSAPELALVPAEDKAPIHDAPLSGMELKSESTSHESA